MIDILKNLENIIKFNLAINVVKLTDCPLPTNIYLEEWNRPATPVYGNR